MFCCMLLYVHSSIVIILMGKRELFALLNSSSWCLVMVERLFLAVQWGCLRFVIVVFPDYTHLLFFTVSITSYTFSFKKNNLTLNEKNRLFTCFQKDTYQHVRTLQPACALWKPSKHVKSGHYRPVSEAPSEWRYLAAESGSRLNAGWEVYTSKF